MALPDIQPSAVSPQVERIATVGQISDLRLIEAKILRLRQEQLLQLLEHIHTLYINSSKEAKTQAFLQIIFELTGRRLQIGEEVRMYVDGEREPTKVHAIDVAAVKALRASRGNQGIGVAAYGADVNASLEINETGRLVQQHKLSRAHEFLEDPELLELYSKMKKQYCFPQSGRVRIVWDIASQFINGKTLSTSDKIEIISKPIDPYIFEQFFFEAVESGLALTSNLHFGAIECLIAHDKIETIAILPQELEKMGYGFEDVQQSSQTGLLIVALNSVINNTPPVIH